MKAFDLKYLIGLLMITLLLSKPAMGQVTIPDPEFKKFLIQNFPADILPNQDLDTIATAAETGFLDCVGNKKIKNVEGVQYFKNIIELKLSGDSLASIPDISKLTKLKRLALDTNFFQTLPDLSKFVNLTYLNARENDLILLPDLSALTKVSLLYVDNNKLTSLPDLSNLASLRIFLISDNQLTSIPDISNLKKLQILLAESNKLTDLPSLLGCTALQRISFYNNKIKRLPDITGLANLTNIIADRNIIDSIPDLTQYPQLTNVTLWNNYLTFEDILPSTNHPNFSSFNFFPQYKVGKASQINVPETEELIIDLDIDHNTTSNIYNWYKDGVLITTTTTSKLSIKDITKANAGVYTCVISNTNPKLAGKTISSEAYTITVVPCISLNEISYTVPDNGCKLPFTLSIDENSLTGSFKPYTYTIKNKIDSSIIISGTNVLEVPKEGPYELRVVNSKNCEVKTTINVKRNEICDPVFYPNGSGIADTYFIELKGKAKIFTTEGDLVNEFTTPAYWDGRTKNGHDAPSGLYVIVVNENTSIKLTLIR